MKNLKKVLALVLAFACAFTMFAGAVVYPDVPAGSEYSEAITMLSDLGIIQGKDDGKYHSEDTITRAEACALIARMLTGDPQVSQYAGASNFTDVVKGSWKESVVGYCVVNGITVGVGNNKFEPDRAITDAEFVTMVVRAMGYETTGTSYPYGHISAAQANGLLDDVTVVPSSAALRGEDAQIIYNALFADYARGAKQVNTTHGTTVEEYPTIAEDVFGLKRAAVGEADKDGNLKNCKAHTWVIGGKICEKGQVDKIWAYPIEDNDTDLYDLDKDAKYALFTYEGDVSNLKGYQVELWGEGQHGEEEYETIEIEGKKTKVVSLDWEIKAIKTLKGQSAYDYNATMDDGKDNDKIKFDDTEVKVGKAQLNNLDEGDLNVKNANQYTLIDWDSDDTIDYVVVDKTYYFMVGSVTSKKVKLNGFDGKEVVTLETDGETDDVAFKDITGADTKRTVKAELPEDLEKDDIIKVTMECVSSKKDAVSTWTVEVVEPETKELTDVDSKGKAWFDDEKIDVADKDYNFTNNSTGKWYDDLDEDDEDSDWDLYRDVNGFIIFAEEADEASKGYIFVTGIEEGANKTGDRNLMVVSGRLDDNSKLEDAKIAKDAKIYLASDLTKDIQDNNEFAYKSKDKTFTAADVIGHAFKYSVNDDDQITKMTEVAADVKSTDNTFDDYTFVDKTDALTVDTNKVWLDDCKVIFAVKGVKPVEQDDKTMKNIFDVNKIAVDPDKDFDLDDVMAVQVEDLPDIGAGEKTTAQGARFSKANTKNRVETVVLGVDTFRYFANSSTAAGLVTYVKYSTKTEKFTITASIPGKDDTTFTTIDTDDLSDESVKSIKALQTLLDTKKGVFCEFEFNTDGEITEMLQMNKTVDAYKNTITPANGTYTVERIVIDHVSNKSSDDTLTGMSAISAGNKIYTKITGTDTNIALDLKDSTEYYVIGEDVELPADGKVLNAYKDGFNKNFDIDDIDEASKSDLVSFFNNTTDDDEYVVADVIVDEGDVVAVYYYEDAIEENTAAAPATVNLVTTNITVVNNDAADTVPAVPAEAQEDTITVAKPATASAVATITINGKVVSVPVADGDTANAIAAAIVREMNNDADVAANFDVAVATDANVVATKASKVLVTAKTAGVSFAMSVNGNGCGAGITSATTNNSVVGVPAVPAKKAVTTITVADKLYKFVDTQIKITKDGECVNVPCTVGDVATAAEVAAAMAAQIKDANFSKVASVTVDGNVITLVEDGRLTAGTDLNIEVAVQTP